MKRSFLHNAFHWILAVLALCTFTSLRAQSDYSSAHAVSTLAGGVPPYGSTDGTGAAAIFHNPDGVAVDASGNVYVAERFNHKIRKISPVGVVTTFAGSGSFGSADGTGAAASFYYPAGVAVDSSGNVFVADTNNSKIRKITPAGVVTTLAGSGSQGSADGTGTAASFYNPTGVAVDAGGNVFVADESNHKIRKISPAGVVTTFAGSGLSGSVDGTGTAARFYQPCGVALDAGGNLFVADQNNHKVRKISPAGVVTTLTGSGSAGSADGTGTAASFYFPTGVAVDGGGNVFVADGSNHKIRRITPAGVVTTFAGSVSPGSADGTGAAAGFYYPTGVAVDAGGNVFVADNYNHMIRKISSSGSVSSLAGSSDTGKDGTGLVARFYSPQGIAVDGSGNVYVADTSNNKIRKITSAGVVSTLAGSGAAGSADGTGTAASFSRPGGVAVDGNDIVYVADTGNKKIRKITAAGVVSTLAGSGSQGSADGAGAAASFSNPSGVAVDSSGIVYVADTSNHKIRKITPAGVVSTLAGSGAEGSTEGSGISASFDNPYGVAVDTGGNVYVADTSNRKIRKISPIGVVSTLAGTGLSGGKDGSGVDASFLFPSGVAVDDSGTVYVADSQFIRRVAASGSVSTIAGALGTGGSADGSGSAARFTLANGVAVDGPDNIYVADTGNHKIRKGVPLLTQQITFPPITNRFMTSPAVSLTGPAAATATSGLPISYKVVSGPATLSGTTLTLTGEGVVTVRASQAGNVNYASAANMDQTFTVTKGGQIITFPVIDNRLMTSPSLSLTGSVAATSTSGLSISYAVHSGPATLSGTTLTLTGEGTVTVTASQAGNFIYNAAQVVSRTFTVSRVSQAIIFPAISNRLFSSGAIMLSATTSSGLPVSYSVVGGPATVSGSSLTLTGAGAITVKAAQAGSASYLPAEDATVSFTVFPNTAAPSSITLSKNWFYDNASLSTVIGTLSSIDPDTGDAITYTLVAGTGSTDNAKFNLSGNSLRTASTAFDYDTQHTASIRVRATDLAGQFAEKAFLLNLVDGTPWAKFELKDRFTESPPSYVNVIYQLKDNTNPGRGINLPKELFEQTNDIFQVKENGSTISPSESFLQVAKLDEVPSKVRTILLLDTSFSVGSNLGTIKSAAKTLVDNMFDQQEIAIYSFSSNHLLIKDFTSKSTANQAALKAAIDSITLGSPSTNLYGSALAMLNLPKWKESFTLAGIETGFLVILTDGEDTSGEATLQDVATKRNTDKKQIFTVGLGASLDPAALTSLGNAGYRPVANVSDVATAFTEIQDSIIDSANSYYWLNYASPKRGDFVRTLTVNLKNNINFSSSGTLTTTFNSNGFSDVSGGVMINRQVDATSGVNSLKIPANKATVARAFTMLGYSGIPSYTWSIGNPALATLSPIGTDGARVTITPTVSSGTTTITLTDTVNDFPPKTIPLIIGEGTPLTPQNITFPALVSRTTTSGAFDLSASASSGLPISFSLVSGPATLSGKTVTLTGSVGTVVVRASQAGNATFAAASSKDQSFSVTLVNSPPTAAAKAITTKEDTTAAMILSGTDQEGGALVYSIVKSPAKGTLVGTAPSLTYKPNANVSGSDSFTFRVFDGTSYSAAATVSIDITAVNDAPVAKAFKVKTTKNKSIATTLSGADVEGSSLKYSIVKAPGKGTLTGTAPKLTYKPKSNFKGTDSFSYRVNDGKLNSATATVNITVAAAAPALASVGLEPTAGLPTQVARAVTSIERIGGLKYLAIEFHKPAGQALLKPRVEVSSNLTDWFSGKDHTTVEEDSAVIYRVRDNTPLTQGSKRYIRMK